MYSEDKQTNNTSQAQQNKQWKFSEILSGPEIRERWLKVRSYFFLRESTYDMTTHCNIRCEGCYYYEGDKQHVRDETDPEQWRKLMQSERERGITYVVLAGAEPSLRPELCKVCYQEMPYGAIATNGLITIPQEVGHKIHISVWGNDTTSLRLRNAENMLLRQIENYKNDPRAIFIYTFTRNNIEESREVIETLAQNGCKVSFNMFSAPVGYEGPLKHTDESLRRCREVMTEMLWKFPRSVVFSPYNAVVHTHRYGLHDLFGCSYPRMNPSRDLGLGRSFRQYRADLSWDREASCCVPDTDCRDCRHYASGSAIVTAKLFRHAENPDIFRAWLDYVDTYLAVWVMGYDKGHNLCPDQTDPPGHSSFQE